MEQYRDKSQSDLIGQCVAACRESKARGMDAALRYYNKDLPARIAGEKETLAELTGWSLHDINAMPGAQRYSAAGGTKQDGQVAASETWWQKLFRSSQ
jgi:hypothetical protein